MVVSRSVVIGRESTSLPIAFPNASRFVRSVLRSGPFPGGRSRVAPPKRSRSGVSNYPPASLFPGSQGRANRFLPTLVQGFSTVDRGSRGPALFWSAAGSEAPPLGRSGGGLTLRSVATPTGQKTPATALASVHGPDAASGVGYEPNGRKPGFSAKRVGAAPRGASILGGSDLALDALYSVRWLNAARTTPLLRFMGNRLSQNLANRRVSGDNDTSIRRSMICDSILIVPSRCFLPRLDGDAERRLLYDIVDLNMETRECAAGKPIWVVFRPR